MAFEDEVRHGFVQPGRDVVLEMASGVAPDKASAEAVLDELYVTGDERLRGLALDIRGEIKDPETLRVAVLGLSLLLGKTVETTAFGIPIVITPAESAGGDPSSDREPLVPIDPAGHGGQ